MSCPTCDHTMERICTFEPDVDGDGSGVFICPRCGTYIIEGSLDSPHVPKIVSRCRSFESCLLRHTLKMDLWRNMGIAESINLPKDRPV